MAPPAEQPTDSPEAYQAYLRGVALRRSAASEPELAARAFEQTVRLDPQFADAHYKRVHMYSLAAWLGLPEDQARHDSLARSALSELKALAAGELQVHLAQGYVAYYLDVDYEHARREFERAAELRPGTLEVVEALGPIYRRLGRYQEAVDMLERAIEIDPLNTTDAHEAAITYMIMKRHRDAERMMDYAIQIEPRNGGSYCCKSLNRLLWTGSSVDARQAQRAATGQAGSLLCWWADLSERNYSAIVSNLNRINTDDLGRSWYGLIFPQDMGQYYFRKALAMRYLGDRDGDGGACCRSPGAISHPGSVKRFAFGPTRPEPGSRWCLPTPDSVSARTPSADSAH